MREMNLAGVDLNLLPALEALLRRRNVTRAAADVGLSQPAMSRVLARLRALIDDPILIKAPGGLAPTARAQAMLPALTASLDSLGGVLRAPAFDEREMERKFRIAAADAQTILIAPLLLAKIQALAPGASLVFEPLRADVTQRIQAGDLDLAFALATTPLPPGAYSERLGEDRLVLMMRRGHPAAETAWALADYARFDHVTVGIFGDNLSEIDAELAEAGVVRRAALTTPHFLAALAAVGASDCVTTLSSALGRRFADTFGLVMREAPLRQTTLPLTMVGAATRANDPAILWLRERLREVAEEVYRDV
jgi:DNA-binding transcriptional LysR family regulator